MQWHGRNASISGPSTRARPACPWQDIAATADTELLRACRCRDPGTGPVLAAWLVAGLVAGLGGAGECGDERGRGCGAGEQG